MQTIVTAEYGSRAIGVATGDSDHDLMSVFVEDPEYVLGIETIDTHASSTAAAGARSTHQDTDITRYPLRKWAKLAAVGNPTVLLLLFLEPLDSTGHWEMLKGIRDAFVSREAGRRFQGYSLGQREAMVGMRNKRTNRPELIHKHGYDTKFAYHMVRTAMQGVELMTTGALRLPMAPGDLEVLRSIRAGAMSKDAVLDLASSLDSDLTVAIARAQVNDQPDRMLINDTLHRIYLDAWASR
ncbi:nucleotidyltransferase domain-containing protein [Herbiconiux sp. A18JL235]|uniref:Nucleotidyltransferase domain-containing protein n=1 Tax=Herbiconiux sp. A18JL235 TaxID=3152363 RepID=A0AB39BEI7_9MICO